MSLNRPSAVRGGQNHNAVPINPFSEQSGDNNLENASAFGRFGDQPRAGIPSETTPSYEPSAPSEGSRERYEWHLENDSTLDTEYKFRHAMAMLDLEEQKEERVDELAEAFKIALGRVKRTPYYVPSKETRDLHRVVSINEPMENKIWPTKEIEYYNRKGAVVYPTKDISKLKVEKYNPLIPILKYTTQTYTTAYAGKGVKTLQPVNYYTKYI